MRCWGYNTNGQLGYGNTTAVLSPAFARAVDLGPGRTARAITAAAAHTCAVLDTGSVRCWDSGALGNLGYANANTIGDDEAPGSLPPVNLGTGRTAIAISTGGQHTCARLDNASVQCWGNGANGRLGHCDVRTIGDDEHPGSVAPVDLGTGGAACLGAGTPLALQPAALPGSPPGAAARVTPGSATARALAAERKRARSLRTCRSDVLRRQRRERRGRCAAIGQAHVAARWRCGPSHDARRSGGCAASRASDAAPAACAA